MGKRQSVSLHTLCHQDPCQLSSCATFTLNSHWGRAAIGKKKKKSCIYACRVAMVLSNSLQPCRMWPARLLFQGFSPGKNTGVYWPILVAIPFQSTIFPAILAVISPEYLVLPESLQPKQLHHLHTWSSQGQTQALQGRLRSKLQWTTHMQRWK